jgi:hypothetical protein
MKSQAPPKPAPPVRTEAFIDRLDPTQRKVLLVGLVFFFFMAASTTLLLAYYIYEPEITTFLQKQTLTLDSSPASQLSQQPVIIIPTQTPSCIGASLQLGTNNWRIEAIQRNADGSVNVPVDIPGVAYWIEDLENNAVFALSPTPENLTLLNALLGGEEALITWENCNTSKYVLSAPEPGVPGAEILSDQSTVGIIGYVPESALAPGVYVQGGLMEETITSFETPESGEYVIDAEISLPVTSTSEDGKTIKVVISILNYGSAPLTFSESDIMLTPEDAAPLELIKSDPRLPEKIKPGESKTFTLDFPRPATDTALLKIFTVEFDLDNY